MFSKTQIMEMRSEYSCITNMDPEQPTYSKLIIFLDLLPKNSLTQLANANIKWVSMLARNRV